MLTDIRLTLDPVWSYGPRDAEPGLWEADPGEVLFERYDEGRRMTFTMVHADWAALGRPHSIVLGITPGDTVPD